MSTLIDEFHGLKVSESRGPKSTIGTNLFRNLKIQEDTPIFSKVRINFVPSSPLTHMVVKSNHLVLSMANMTLMKIDLLQPDDIVEIDLRKFSSGGKVYKVFMDPSGQHILISIAQNETTAIDVLYIPWKSVKPRVCSKLKDIFVTAVGWNLSHVTDQMTGPVLIGASDGTLYEIELLSDIKLVQNGFEKNLKQIFNLNLVNNFIVDLYVAQSIVDRSCYVIFCATPSNLCTFKGFIASMDERPFYTNIFVNYANDSGSVVNLINTQNWRPMLQLLYKARTNSYEKFVWMTDETLFSSNIEWKIIRENPKLKRTQPYQSTVEESGPPRSFVVTNYHIIIAWPNKILAYCLINGQVILEDRVPENAGAIVGVTEDQKSKTVWAFSEKAVFKYKIEREDRNMWKAYLDMRLYEEARIMCSKDESLLEFIVYQEAEDLYKEKKYIESAEIFARVKASFEEICLRFMNEEEALKAFLRGKLNYLAVSEQAQTTVVVLWLMELYLKELGSLRDANQLNSSKYEEVSAELKSFRDNPKVRKVINENSNAIYNLHLSHDDQDNYVAIAVIMKDFNRVILHLISHNRHIEALQIMKTQGSVKLFYQHTSALLQVIPDDTIDALISLGHLVDPKTLLPMLVHAHATCGHSEQVLRYVEFCVDKLDISDKVMHNFLITLYCLHAPEKLIDYLKLQGDDGNYVSYDVKFALRECMTAGHDEACIHILTTMNLYKDAVELALKTDITLAKAVAKRTKYNESICKELWLMIASHVIQRENDVGKAMEILKECSLIKIEDILPFFPDFVTIDQFKDSICSSLESYNEQINALKTEMNDASKVAGEIRENIKKVKQKKCTVKADDTCNECKYPLLTRSFYIFNCGHKFHQDCLSDAIMNYLPPEQQKLLSDLRGKLIATSSDRVLNAADREDIKLKIDGIIATDCLYCGDIAINNIDSPFIADANWDSVIADWD